MDLSIIIVSYNTKHLLQRCLVSVFNTLSNTSLQYEIIVVDNNSSDGSPEFVRTAYKQATIIRNRTNVGFGKANNQAMRKASGEFVLLLNSDCVVEPQAIERLLQHTQQREREGKKVFMGGKLLNEDRTPQPSCGPFYSLLVVFVMLFLKGDQLKLSRYSPDTDTEVDWISGACILTKRSHLVALGGFDEDIFLYMEEIDLLYRAKLQGYKVYFTPEAVFIHTGAASSGSKKEPVVNIFSGLFLFYKKHRPGWELIVLSAMLRLKAWLVIGICGIMGRRELKILYAKALAVLQ